MALLFRDFDKRVEIRSSREGLIRFRQHHEAVLYLRKHRGRTGLIATLRQILAEHHHLQVRLLSDDPVIDEVARRLLGGSLQLMEMFEPRVHGPTTEEQEEEESREEAPLEDEPAAAPISAAQAAPAAAAPPEEPALLPLLEEVQIEGAEVLPEVMQTLEQIDLTMESIDLATVSLEPAPSGVPKISSAMQQASSSVTTTIDGL